ncbi:MAG: cytochrome-c peroxidase, partial [Gammaproteobacteria bacterium]|nr:cytochrome-c peroxidase [Gammaproteobacteria bacterium]
MHGRRPAVDATGASRTRSRRLRLLLILGATWAGLTHAHFGPIPMSLKGVPVPPVPGLLDGPAPIVVDEQKAIALGKALFWDMNVGSDGVACASCHFHAGADARVKNQIAPSARRSPRADVPGATFDLSPDGRARGVNSILRRIDFPLHRTADPLAPNAEVLYSSDDIVGSAGTFAGRFVQTAWFGPGTDECIRSPDPVFHVGAFGTRRVQPRHTPTVINAVFNHRNFWDGRANNIFNGSSPWGERDPDAGVWVDTPEGLIKQPLHLINSSLASQAVAPPLSDIEMGCSDRRFADLGRKLMWRRPLERQQVHWNDSVLGPLANSTPGNPRPGLRTYYYWLVREAFHPRFWRSHARGGELGSPPTSGRLRPLPYDQFEANFGMFFALAIQLYESTLISDDSPFDRSARDAEGLPTDLSQAELDGLQSFRVAHCSLCHIGPLLSAATVATNAILVKTDPHAFGSQQFAISTSDNVVTRMSVLHERGDTELEEGGAILDTGFTSTGVTPSEWDVGLGGTDPFGNPLSFAVQYLRHLVGDDDAVLDPPVREVRPCDFDVPLALDSDSMHPTLFTAVDGIQTQAQSTQDCYNPAAA